MADPVPLCVAVRAGWFRVAELWTLAEGQKKRMILTFNCEGEYHSFLLSLGQRPKLSHAEPTSAHRPAKRNWIGHPALAAAICWSSCCESFKTLQQKRSQKCWKHCSQIQ